MQLQTGMAGANLLWLPAGVALSATLLRGAAALPAIALATLSFNLYLSPASTSASTGHRHRHHHGGRFQRTGLGHGLAAAAS